MRRNGSGAAVISRSAVVESEINTAIRTFVHLKRGELAWEFETLTDIGLLGSA